ncbi:hypothetical protein BGZ65_008369, partial [Modicella reniformis]
EARRLVQSLEGVQVHVESIQQYLKQQGIKGYVQRKKPDLTKKQIAAKDHLKWTVDDWKNVMFS